MIVSRVTHVNLDKLYEAILIANNNPDFNKKMGDHTINLLKNVSITIDMVDVTEYETFMLKMFSNDQNFWIGERNISVDGCGVDNALTFTGIHQLTMSMLKNSDVPVKPGGIFFSTGNLRNDISMTFTGFTLYNILSTLPDQFFKNYNIQQAKERGDTTITADNALVDNVDFGKSLENYIVNEFTRRLWDFFKNEVNTIDLAADSYINNKYYSFVNNSSRDVVLAEVVTPYGGISFLDDENEDIESQIKQCKKTFSDLPSDRRSLPFKSTNLFFVINCDFYTFLEMFLALPSRYFVNRQDVKTIFGTNQISFDPIYDNYKTRISVKISECMKIKNNASQNKENNLIRYNSIPLMSSYKFMMQISLNDISSELLRYETLIKEGYYSDECNDYLSYSILNILNMIKKNSQTVYQLLSK